MRRCGDERLVEGNGQYQMGAVIADVTGLEDPGVVQLILQVKRPVLRIRQFVIDVVTAKQERTIKIAGGPASRVTASSLLQVGQVVAEGCCRGWRGRRQRRAEWLRERCAFRDGDRLNERRRQCDTERAVKAGSRARRKLAEVLAAVIVQPVPGAHCELRRGSPREADAWRESPLVIFHERIAGAGRGSRLVIPSNNQAGGGNNVGP